MSDRNEIFSIIIGIIGKNVDLVPRIPLSAVKPDSELGPDCGYDSLALMSILYELQETYPSLDEEAITGVKTINDLIDNISRSS